MIIAQNRDSRTPRVPTPIRPITGLAVGFCCKGVETHGQPHWVAPTRPAVVGARNGILLKHTGILLKHMGNLLKHTGILLKNMGILLKNMGNPIGLPLRDPLL